VELNKTKLLTPKIWLYAIIVISSLVMLFPFYWMVTRSLMFRIDVESAKYFFPPRITLVNYIAIILNQLGSQFSFLRAAFNSIIYVCFAVSGVVIVNSMAGFVLAKRPFRGSQYILYAIIGSMMLPSSLFLLPNFIITYKLGLYNTYPGLIIPCFVSPFSLFLFRQYMLSTPDSLLDAAAIDGCNIYRTFFAIVIPISTPVISTVVILSSLNLWNYLIWPLIITTDPKLAVLTVALVGLRVDIDTFGWSVILAAVTLMSIPMITLYFLGQKWLISGLTSGAVKE